MSIAGGKATAKIVIGVGLTNPTSGRFEVSDAYAMLHYQGKEPFASISTDSVFVVFPKFEGELSHPLTLSMDNPVSVLLSGFEVEGLEADIYATLRSGLVRKDYKRENIPVEDLARRAGLDRFVK